MMDLAGLVSGAMAVQRQSKCSLYVQRRQRVADGTWAVAAFYALVRQLLRPLPEGKLRAVGADLSRRPALVRCFVESIFCGQRSVVFRGLFLSSHNVIFISGDSINNHL
jgi:hypothetical protein